MAGRRMLPDVPTLLRHIDKGLTHGEIGELYGTSRQAVTLKLKGVVSPQSHRRDWPWEVQPRHKQGWLYTAISNYTVARSKERVLSKREQQRLSAFLDMLDRLEGDYVVDYFPDTATGFELRPRAPERDDPDSIIGVPERPAA